MNFANPTALALSAQGLLNGRRYTVIGRVVMGMELEGETYYWQEFNLADDVGGNATLVFEEGDAGPEWKLFKLMEPFRPMSAAEAGAKREGDLVNLDGTPVRITLVDQSTVYHIEGAAPKGVEIGDVADYFNADAGQWMLVASWTGEEIEFYRGTDVSAASVAMAFGLPRPSLDDRAVPGFSALGGALADGQASGLVLKIIGAVMLAVIGYGVQSSWSTRKRNAPLVTQSAPASPLTNGMRGTLALREYTISSAALVEVSKVGAKYTRHEYDLLSSAGDQALLVCNLTGAGGWHLLLTPQTPPALSPLQAGALRLGDTVIADDAPLRVAELFQFKTLSALELPGPSGFPGAVHFGFVARSTNDWLVAGWTESGIEFHCGRALPEASVLAAFGVKAQTGK